jgi:hypothetical protein
MASDADSGHDSDEADPETEWLFPSNVRADPATRAGSSSTAATHADADRIAAFEEAAFSSDSSGAFPTDPDARTESDSGVVPATAAASGATPRAGRSRKRDLVVAAVVVLVIMVAAVGVVAAIRRDGGAKSSSGVPAVRGERSTSTTSRAQVTTTIAPTVAPSAPSTLPSTPTSFTVRANCGGRDCAVAVRERPSTGARQVATLRTGQIVQINCSTHGDSIDDRDTGRRSDVWYRFADTDGYSSALYLEGPTVADCG